MENKVSHVKKILNVDPLFPEIPLLVLDVAVA